MSRDPIQPGDHVICTLIGDGPYDGPFPHYIEGTVISLHDDFVTVWDDSGLSETRVRREHVITDDQMKELRKRFLREEE